MFAAASHTTVNDLVNGINRIRLKTDQDYYNTGVLLMDLDRGRTDIHPQEIFQHVQEHGSELLLPDQDVFNTLYGAKTLWIDDALWNYDARYYPGYLLRSNGAYHMDWVMQNTAILHFCGKRKPWKKHTPAALPRSTSIITSWPIETQRLLPPFLLSRNKTSPRGFWSIGQKPLGF